MTIKEAHKLAKKAYKNKQYLKTLQICQDILNFKADHKKTISLKSKAQIMYYDLDTTNNLDYRFKIVIPTGIFIVFILFTAFYYNNYSFSFQDENSDQIEETSQVLADPVYADNIDKYTENLIPYISVKNYKTNTPATVIFDASNSKSEDGTEIKRYIWNFGDGKMGKGEIVKHTFSNVGNYQVILRIEDDQSRWQVTALDLAIGRTKGEAPLAAITSNPKTLDSKIVAEAPFKVLLEGKYSTDLDGQVDSYEWNLGDGSYSKEQTVFHYYEIPGIYVIDLLVTDDIGNTNLDQIKIYLE